MNRIDIIQSYIDKYGYKTYLEIGVQAGHCFRAIVCEEKTGVDPDPSSAATVHVTSDQFFNEIHKPEHENKIKFDCIFIDGLHHADQVYKDIMNSLECLADGGTILMHDCKPTSEFMQRIPLTTQVEWTGDTWKAYVKVRQERDDLSMFVIDTDWGVGVIRKGKQEKIVIPSDVPVTYDSFVIHNAEWLNIVSVDEFNNSMSQDDKTYPPNLDH